MLKRGLISRLFILPALILICQTARAKQIELTLDSAVEIAMSNSYRMKMLKMDIDESMFWLRARKAGLKTQIYMNLKTPDLQRVSDYKWNSTLYRNELIRTNTQLWQSDLAIKQPLMFFGFPTNGYLSLNYTVYKYLQFDNGEGQDYYNRLYLKFEQPFLLPNTLKNNLEEAELNLDDIKLSYVQGKVGIMNSIAYDFYELFERSYSMVLYQNQLDNLEQVLTIAQDMVNEDPSRKMELTQIELEISNVKENQLSNQTELRQRMAVLKQRLRLPADDSLYVIPVIQIIPIDVNEEQAVEYGMQNSPHLKRLQVRKRRSEIFLSNQRGRNAFHLTLEMTYGLEKTNHRFLNMFEEYDNSNSITLNAYVPIWDGGERKARIQAGTINVMERDLEIEEEELDIKSDIANAYADLSDYYERSITMKNSMDLAAELTEASIQRYASGEISIQDLLQVLERHKDTEIKFLGTYLGYRKALLAMVYLTYYNFEKRMSLVDELDLHYRD